MSQNLKKMINAIVTELEECLPALSDLYLYRSINDSFGVQLDYIGEIVGETRKGRNDSDYRTAIEFKIFLNVSSGEPETLIKSFKDMTDSSKVYYSELYPANVILYGNGSNYFEQMKTYIDELAAGGVRVFPVLYPDIDNPFVYDDENSIPNLPGLGYNEVSYTESGIPVGGQYCELFS